jgi:hypothetical protein
MASWLILAVAIESISISTVITIRRKA